MFTISRCRLFVMALIFISSQLWSQSRIAVLPFQNNSGSSLEFMSQGMADMFITSFSQHDGLIVVERSRVQALMKEMEFTLSGGVDEESAVELGKLLGAKQIVLGSFMKLGSEIRIDARLVDIESGSVIPGSSRAGTAESLEEVDNVVDEISAAMAGKITLGGDTAGGDASLKAQLEISYSKFSTYQAMVDGVPLEYTGDEDGISRFKVSHGKHHIGIYKGIFRPKLVLEKQVELSGGYITRMRYDIEKNELIFYSESPSDELMAKIEKSNSTVNSDKKSINSKIASTSTQVDISTEQKESSLTSKVSEEKGEPISEERYMNLKKQLKSEPFDDRRLGLLQLALKNRNVNTDQLIGLIECFTFSSQRVEVAKFCFERLVDRDEFYNVLTVFSSPFTRDELREWADEQS